MFDVVANGANIPALGFGTWTLEQDAVVAPVLAALKTGYRHIDTASFYNNEEAIGSAIKESHIPREEIFITTKVWFTDVAEGDLQRSIETSLRKLDISDVNLALIHVPSKEVPLSTSVAALNDVRDRGLARHIGVSNFTVRQVDEAVACSRYPLVCNQVEYHPFLSQERTLESCRRHGMAMVSYCPLARVGELFSQDPIVHAAQKYGKTPAQVILRWHIQHENVVAIPRSTDPGRIRENFQIFDFELDEDAMREITALQAKDIRLLQFEFFPDFDAD